MIQTNSFTFASSEIPLLAQPSQDCRYPMPEAQLEVWLSSQQSTEANCAYNEIATLEFDGFLNRNAIESALQIVFQRHGSLRTTFDRHGNDVVEQPFQNLEIESIDWLGLGPLQIQKLRRELIVKLGSTPFDLERGPLFRAILQRESESKHRLTIVAHHLALDGWSLGLIVKELGTLYDHCIHGKAAEPLPPAPSYADYAKAMSEHANSQAGQKDLAYWGSQFADGTPALDLPLSGNRGALRTYRASRIEHVLPAGLVTSVRKLGAKNGCSLYNTVLAAFQAFVARLAQTDDLVLAIPTAGQSALNFLGLVGHCVNTLPLRIRIDKQSSFTEHLKRSRSGLLSGIDHQRFSFGTLLKHLKGERDPSRPPLCAISFNLAPAIDLKNVGFTGLVVHLHVEPRTSEHFEWFVNGVILADQSIELQVQFNQDLFEANYIEYYFEGFQAFLEYLVGNPMASLGEVPMMSLGQRQTMLVQWNDSKLEYPKDSNLPAELTRQAQATPDKIAVRSSAGQLTYRQLDEQSNQFARFLRRRGVERGDLVGICTNRSPRLLVQVLGILKAGAGYVPLDPQYPADRLRTMCDDSQLKLIVSERNLAATVSKFNKPVVMFEDLVNGGNAVASSHLNDSLQQNEQTHINPADVCYVIYTSGSTGKPKGVMVPHGAVVNFLYSMKQKPGYDSQDNLLAITTLSFDIAVLELYLPLLFGGTVFIADWETATDGKKLMETVEREDIRLMQATPATWRMMISSGWQGKKGLRILCGGEPMPQELVEPLLQRCSELWNMYGPTETTVWSTAHQIRSADSPISIGRPIGNTQIFLLDSHGQEVPVGVEAEVHIGGAGVTRGYWNRPDLTGERFVDNPYFNPFEDYVNHHLYRTGDIAVYRMDGNIEYRRRNDKQIKLRGFRIELGEIESAILNFSGIAQAVVIVRNDQPGDSRLTAYVTANNLSAGGEWSIDGLREHLRTMLPHYMIPQNFVILDAMPLTENGKVNVKALPIPDSLTADAAAAPCQTRAERYLETIWKELLQLDSVSRNDNFFDVGGHSLLVMQVINEIEKVTKIRLSPQEFLLGTLEQIATSLDESEELPTVEPPDGKVISEKKKTGDRTNASSPFDCLKRFWR